MLKSDKQGFLVGELLTGQRESLEFQQVSAGLLRNIRTDVRGIARFLGARTPNSRPAEPAGRSSSNRAPGAPAPAERASAASQQPRDNAGRFVAAPRAVTVKRSAREEQQASKVRTHAVATAATAAAKAALSTRDGRGRFAGGPGRPGGGRGDGGGEDGPDGFGSGIAERLGGIKTAIEGMASGAEQMDPAVAAMHEVKDVVAPFGRGMFALLGRTAEKKKERWYQRILAAIKGRKSDMQPAPQLSTGEGLGIGAVAGMAARFLPALLGALPALLAGAGGFLLGTAIGQTLYKWLDESGVLTKIFDAFDAAKNWIKDKIGAAKETIDRAAANYTTARDLARSGGLDASGRNSNDPRRLDAPSGIAGAAGSVVGSFQRGADYMTPRTSAENRALITGRSYRAGNIAGLDDAHTRALVASTVATESSGGNLGTVNKAGYMGRYQAGAGWLADAGLIKGGPDAVKAAMKAEGFSREYDWGKAGGMTRFLQNDANWKDGMSYSKYLRSADVQDGAFKANSDKSYADMLRKGVITPNTSPEEVAGLLKARHIAGLGGATAVAAGGAGPADANGTTARKYFDDLTKDRGGFLSSYSGSAATVGTQRVPVVAVPSTVPDKIPAAQAVEVPQAGASEQAQPVRVVVREPIGQDVGDRKIAQIVSGGIGGN